MVGEIALALVLLIGAGLLLKSLRALAAVDAVVVFDEDSPASLIAALRPDVHAKGTDYTTDSVPEREAVAAYGGRTAIVGDPKDHSTTDVVTRIRERR